MSLKVLLLDPAKPVTPPVHQLPKFLRLAMARQAWDVSRPEIFQAGIDGKQCSPICEVI